MKNIVILISGGGSNMAAIVRASQQQNWAAQVPARVVAVISNKASAGGLAWARGEGIATQALDHKAFASREAFDAELAATIEAAAQGGYKGARVVVKINALTDAELIHALLRTAQAGARIDLIVRGMCSLRPGVPGLSDNIRVRSVIGRLLEHSRVFYFRLEEADELYLSSADWMNRNMLRRVELAWPINDPVLRQRIIDECLVAYLHDDRDAWTQAANGVYQRAPHPTTGRGAQNALMGRYGPAASAAA